ncbi:hypothetical protein [Halomonas sp. GT]|uniref:hypothetical protein n=1 Tax=Halomonas sp. GT TaxID=1971364 RepID=UPI0009F47C68|nr:hypothetical protein [Halomonas sp. GT]
MKFSMNGFRRQFSGDVKELRFIIKNVINDEWYSKEELAEALNAVVQHSNVLNCIYSSTDPDFTDMSDLEVEHLDLDEEHQDEEAHQESTLCSECDGDGAVFGVECCICDGKGRLTAEEATQFYNERSQVEGYAQ